MLDATRPEKKWAEFTKEGNYLFKIIKAYDNNGGDFCVYLKVAKSPFKDDAAVGEVLKQYFKADPSNPAAARNRYFFLTNFFKRATLDGESEEWHVSLDNIVGKYVTGDVKIREYNGKTYYNVWTIRRVADDDGLIGEAEELFQVQAKRWKSENKPEIDPTQVPDITKQQDFAMDEIPF